MSPLQGPCADFQLGNENQPIGSGILTHLSRNIRAESNLLADEKGSLQQGDPGSCLVIHLYLYIY